MTEQSAAVLQDICLGSLRIAVPDINYANLAIRIISGTVKAGNLKIPDTCV